MKIFGIISNSYNIGKVIDENSNYAIVGGIVGRNGYAANRLPIIIDNCYCSSETSASYNYWDGTKADIKSTTGIVDLVKIQDYDITLGLYNWKKDTYGINNEYPILKWQKENT